jgi:ribokinase
MKNYDFVAVGDITTDAFIRLKDASVTCDVNREDCKLCVTFGDKVPYESVEIIRAVGNSANAAVSASRLGLKSALVANIGGDQNGKECLEVLEKESVATDFITTHKDKETNYHYVLWYEDERTILVKHQEFDYHFPDIGSPAWLYLSSLGGNTENYHQEIASYLESHPDIKLAFQPGTFQMKLGYKKLESLYKRSEIFFCNVEEAKRILEIKDEISIPDLLEKMRALGPKIIVITDGPKGAYTYDGNEKLFMPIYPDTKPPYERTGAGDAFASTVTAALVLGKEIKDALTWGPINSASVVQDVGAQRGLLTRENLEKELEKAPENYKLQTL